MIRDFITTNLIKGLIMKKIEIIAIGRVVELENIIKKFKYDMIVGRLVKE